MSDERVVYGIHAVAEAIRARPEEIDIVLLQRDLRSKRLQEIVDDARQRQISVRFTGRDPIRQLAGTAQHQGVAARLRSFAYAELGALIASPRPRLLLALDGIVDPRNLGAILRSAEAMGAGGVVIPRDRATGVTPTAAKAAAGAAERIPVCRVTNLVRALQEMRSEGIWTVGADAAAERAIETVDLSTDICLVIGAEHKGLRPLVRKQCDHIAAIPLVGTTASLNASVAAAILLYECRRQRDLRAKE